MYGAVMVCSRGNANVVPLICGDYDSVVPWQLLTADGFWMGCRDTVGLLAGWFVNWLVGL